MKKLVGFAVAMTALSAGAAVYYVDSAAGDDLATGTSPLAAWRSLEKVNAAELRPGDEVRFRRGGLWRGSLVPCSGEPGRPVTYTSYGTGPKPILQQSVDRSRPEDWFELEPGLWSTRVQEPVLHEQVWCPSVGDSCTHSFQEGMKGTLRKVSEEGGATFWRVTCTGEGARREPHLIQIWGPKMAGFPKNVLLKMQVRASKPFPLVGVRLMQGSAPWTGSHAGDFQRRDQQVGADWREVSVRLTEIKGAMLTGEPRFHLAIGDVLPVGGTFDFRILGVWRAEVADDADIPADVGIFICDHGARWGVKKWCNPAWTVPKTERWQRSTRLENELDYWYDPDGRRVVVKFPRNPGEAFSSIELALARHVVNEGGRHDVTFDGLWVRYGAAHGFGGGSTRNIAIRNCDVCWIGGGLQFWRRDEKTGRLLYPVRYGNGIEFWGDCASNLVERCRLWEIYDAALTNQGRDDEETDVTWRDNVIWNAEYSFEYWNAKLTRNVRFEHNTCVDAGRGWAHAQRPDPNGAHLMYYSNRAATTNFVVRDNIFCRATEWTCRSALDWRDGLLHSRNLVWNDAGVPAMRWKEGRDLRLYPWADYVKELQMDLDSVFAEPQFVDPARRDYRLKPGSPGWTLASDGGPVGARDFGAKGVLVLSFDDRNFNDWLNALPLFEKYGAHATFFVCGPIDGEAVRVMKRLSEAGHSVGLHGLRHANADEAIAKKGADLYYKEEIEPQREACRVAYIPIKSFAYPNSRRSDESDALFRRKGFAHVRGGHKGVAPFDPKGEKQEGLKPIHTVDRAFLPADKVGAQFRLDTVIAGEAYHTDIDDILACIRRCAERNEAFVLTSHGISPHAKHINMKTEWLERILATAKECGVAVLGFDEL